ncbi:hypothetical protein MKEN_01121500 [Mycena kentingensis (nom. inval.)]|nr:hypothetical protein MKEN_01121500 [Mycena kentingensis (nom. inval.)]
MCFQSAIASRQGVSHIANPRSLNQTNVSSDAGALWQAASNEEKAPYREGALMRKADHMLRYPGYRYQPLGGGPRKSKPASRRPKKNLKEQQVWFTGYADAAAVYKTLPTALFDVELLQSTIPANAAPSLPQTLSHFHRAVPHPRAELPNLPGRHPSSAAAAATGPPFQRGAQPVEELLNMLSGQPDLRHLKVAAPNVADDADVINNLLLPWAKLETLELQVGIEVRVIHDILIAARSLRTCIVRELYHRSAEYLHLNATIRPPSVTLPNLETLVLSCGDGAGFSYPLYDYLVLPGLTTLDTDSVWLNDTLNNAASLRDLKGRSSFSLRTLRLGSLSDPEHLLGLLQNNPEIEELALKRQARELFTSMAEREDLLPNLTRFTFSDRYDAKWSSVKDECRPLVEMLEARCRVSPGAACARLASVELRLKGARLSDDLEAILDGLVEDGLLKDVYTREEKHGPRRRRPILGRVDSLGIPYSSQDA